MAFSGSELKQLGEVISENSFWIPDYQRGYSWQSAQWKAIWQDLENISRAKAQQHFTGIMLLRPSNNSVEVTDGQQRLITVMIIANALRRRCNKDQANYKIAFSNNEDMQNHFAYYALGNKSLEARLSSEPSSYAINIKKSVEYFTQQATGITVERATELLDVLLTKFKIFILEVAPGFDIHVAFETLNNRGKPLSQMELLKNRLIYLSHNLEGNAEEAEELRKEIHEAWTGIYRSLGRSEKTQNQDDEFLLAHAITYFQRKREAGWLDKTLFESTFSLSNKNLDFGYIQKYVMNLEFAAKWWSHIHAADHMPKSHQKWLERIQHAGFAYFKPLILSAYMRASFGLPGAVSEPNKSKEQLSCVESLLKEIERYIVIIFRLLGNNGSLDRADFEGAAFKLREPGNDKKLGEIELGSLSTVDAILLVADYVKSSVDNRGLTEDVFLDTRFPWPGHFTEDGVSKAIQRRFRESTGYYNWDFTKLVLFEYEEKFRQGGNSPVKVGWDDFSFDETVEHIYPRNPSDKGDGYWNKHIPIDGRSNRNGKLSSAIQNSLGNLLFLSRSDNSSVSNGPYTWIENGTEKGKIASYRNASYSATEVANTFKNWDVQSISIRGIAICKFIEERWDITLSENPEDLQTYLKLCFGAEVENIESGKAGKKVSTKKLVKGLSGTLA